jgi:polar amino acid transport system substrate-binding protein
MKIIQNRIVLLGCLAAALALFAGCSSRETPAPTQAEAEPTSTSTSTSAPPAQPSDTPVADVDVVWQNVQQEGKIRVGISADYPPFAYVADDFSIQGYDLALIAELSKRLNLPMDIHNLAFDGLANALQLGEIDMAIAAISVTESRDQVIDFSNVYFVSDDAALVDNDSTISLTDPQQLASYRVGIQQGSIYQDWLQETLIDPGLMAPQNMLLFSSAEDALTALDPAYAQAQIVLMDYLPAEVAARQKPVKIIAQGLNPERYAIAIPQGAFELQTRLNEALIQMQNDGTLALLAQNYLDIDNVAPLPTPAPTAIPATPAGCLDGMAYVADLNYPDNNMTTPAQFQPGTVFQKGWRIANTGTCTWNNSYVLEYVGSNPVNAPVGGAPVAIQGTVTPGQTYDIYVTITAPWQPGKYQSFWQLRNPTGMFFGTRLWAGMQVVGQTTPTPGPGAPLITKFKVSDTQIELGACVTVKWEFTGQGISLSRLFRSGKVIMQDLPYKGETNDCPNKTGVYEYRLQVDSGGGTANASQYVTVYEESQPTPTPQPTAEPPVIYSFTADPDGIALGECTTLSWSYSGRDLALVELRRGKEVLNQGMQADGSMQDCPTGVGSYTYTLVVSSEFGGTATQFAYVDVYSLQIEPRISTWQWMMDRLSGIFTF